MVDSPYQLVQDFFHQAVVPYSQYDQLTLDGLVISTGLLPPGRLGSAPGDFFRWRKMGWEKHNYFWSLDFFVWAGKMNMKIGSLEGFGKKYFWSLEWSAIFFFDPKLEGAA